MTIKELQRDVSRQKTDKWSKKDSQLLARISSLLLLAWLFIWVGGYGIWWIYQMDQTIGIALGVLASVSLVSWFVYLARY